MNSLVTPNQITQYKTDNVHFGKFLAFNKQTQKWIALRKISNENKSIKTKCLIKATNFLRGA